MKTLYEPAIALFHRMPVCSSTAIRAIGLTSVAIAIVISNPFTTSTDDDPAVDGLDSSPELMAVTVRANISGSFWPRGVAVPDDDVVLVLVSVLVLVFGRVL